VNFVLATFTTYEQG